MLNERAKKKRLKLPLKQSEGWMKGQNWVYSGEQGFGAGGRGTNSRGGIPRIFGLNSEPFKK